MTPRTSHSQSYSKPSRNIQQQIESVLGLFILNLSFVNHLLDLVPVIRQCGIDFIEGFLNIIEHVGKYVA